MSSLFPGIGSFARRNVPLPRSVHHLDVSADPDLLKEVLLHRSILQESSLVCNMHLDNAAIGLLLIASVCVSYNID